MRYAVGATNQPILIYQPTNSILTDYYRVISVEVWAVEEVGEAEQAKQDAAFPVFAHSARPLLLARRQRLHLKSSGQEGDGIAMVWRHV
jgi:hypothetical protein